MKIGLLNFSIILDRSDAIFGLGDYVSGVSFISLTGQLDLSHFEVRLFGSAETKWEESRSTGSGDDSRTETVTYHGQHKYIDMSRFLTTESTDKRIIRSGEHRIPFSFELPLSGIANSFEGHYGNIRYYVEAVIHKPGLLSIDHRVKVPIRVEFPVFVPDQQLNTPIAYSNEKTVGCCFSKQLVQLKASIAHTGQKAGSSTSVNCITVNRSNKSMQLRARLKQNILYKASGSSKADRKTIVTSVGSIVSPGMTNNESLIMPIPDGLPILYNQCPIIQLDYVIVVTLVIPGSIDLHVELPVILTNQELAFHVS